MENGKPGRSTPVIPFKRMQRGLVVQALTCGPTARGNWIIEFKSAAYPTEADLIRFFRSAAANRDHGAQREPAEGGGPARAAHLAQSRYLTMERTGDPASFAFCGWLGRRHENYGFISRLSMEAFEDQMLERCA